MGICKSMDADESMRKQMEEKKEEIKREFEIEMSKNVANFWREEEEEEEEKEEEEEEERITDVTEEFEILAEQKERGNT